MYVAKFSIVLTAFMLTGCVAGLPELKLSSLTDIQVSGVTDGEKDVVPDAFLGNTSKVIVHFQPASDANGYQIEVKNHKEKSVCGDPLVIDVDTPTEDITGQDLSAAFSKCKFSKNKKYTILISTIDASGAIHPDATEFEFSIDLDKPVISGNDSTTVVTVNDHYKFKWTGSDPNHGSGIKAYKINTYHLDGSTNSGCNNGVESQLGESSDAFHVLNNLEDFATNARSYFMSVIAVDNSGNESSAFCTAATQYKPGAPVNFAILDWKDYPVTSTYTDGETYRLANTAASSDGGFHKKVFFLKNMESVITPEVKSNTPHFSVLKNESTCFDGEPNNDLEPTDPACTIVVKIVKSAVEATHIGNLTFMPNAMGGTAKKTIIMKARFGLHADTHTGQLNLVAGGESLSGLNGIVGESSPKFNNPHKAIQYKNNADERRVVILDTDNHRVVVWDRDNNQILKIFGTLGECTLEVCYPVDAVHVKNFVYILNRGIPHLNNGSGTVFRYDINKSNLTLVNYAGHQAEEASVVAEQLADTNKGKIAKSKIHLSSPSSIAGYHKDTYMMFVSEPSGNRIIFIPGNKDARNLEAQGESLNKPEGITMDIAGAGMSFFYVANSGTHQILKMSVGQNASDFISDVSNGFSKFNVFAGTGTRGTAIGPALSAEFDTPVGLGTYNDTVYVTEKFNNHIRRIAKFSPNNVSTWGEASFGYKNGDKFTSEFHRPLGISGDHQNELEILVADRMNHAIRRYTAPGVFTTFLGGSENSVGDVLASGNTARFDTIRGLAASDEHIFFADRANGKIKKIRYDDPSDHANIIDVQTQIVEEVTTSEAIAVPDSIAYDPSDGSLYVTDLREISYGRTSHLLVQDLLPSPVTNPVANSDSRIVKIDSSGNVTTILTGTVGRCGGILSLPRPSNLNIDGNTLYFTDSAAGLLRLDLNSPTYECTTVAGLNEDGLGIVSTTGLSVVGSKAIMARMDPDPVTQSVFNQINPYLSEVDLSDNSHVHIGGNPSVSTGFVDNATYAFGAQFGLITGLTTDGQSFYAMDFTNHAIRRIQPGNEGGYGVLTIANPIIVINNQLVPTNHDNFGGLLNGGWGFNTTQVSTPTSILYVPTGQLFIGGRTNLKVIE